MTQKLIKTAEGYSLQLSEEAVAELGITEPGDVDVTVQSGSILIRPANQAMPDDVFQRAMDKAFRDHEDLLRRLA